MRVLAKKRVIVGAGLLLGACSIQPWDKPYERDRLADPIMSWMTARASFLRMASAVSRSAASIISSMTPRASSSDGRPIVFFCSIYRPLSTL